MMKRFSNDFTACGHCGNLMNYGECGSLMRPANVSSLQRDDRGLTAVIEFLSAFTLFLMILTAFLSLAQLQMGSNDPAVDRLDRAAAMGLDRLTSSEGWFVPLSDDSLDYANSTAEWHLHDAASLNDGRVQPGLMEGYRLSMDKILALNNVTEHGMSQGLGLSEDFSLHLSIIVIESSSSERLGEVLFNGGTNRGSAPSSSTAYRTFYQEGEALQVVLEVHDGGRKNNILQVTEIMARPSSSGPEWIEINNPNNFAIALRGWSLNHTSSDGSTNYLFQSGVLSGNSVSLLSGDPTTQVVGNATHVLDLGQEGFLGIGSVDGLGDGGGVLRLRYTQLDEVAPGDVMRASWGGDTGLFLVTGQSLQWGGIDRFTTSSWSITDVPTPGEN